MNRKQFKAILARYLNNKASDEEKKLLENWYFQEAHKKKHDDIDGSFLFLKDEIWRNILRKSGVKSSGRTTQYWFVRIAAVLLIGAFSVFAYQYSQRRTRPLKNSPATAHVAHPVMPGKNQATLTLPNGRNIPLSSLQNGIVISANKVRYNNGEAVTDRNDFLSSDSLKEYPVVSLTTPRGGQYSIILADGTKVWLNAASELKYPVQFDKVQRRVTLSGEGYFEVAKDQRPFIVHSGGQEVTVLGTHFNINAYNDEPSIKTTLLEGSVKISSLSDPSSKTNHKVLTPGQQSVYRPAGPISVNRVSTGEMIAWKEGYFEFNHADLQSVMRQISRWYNVEVQYKNKVAPKSYSGKISREVTASELIEMLNYLGIRCEIASGKIIIQ